MNATPETTVSQPAAGAGWGAYLAFSGYYATYFGVIGVMVPYWPLYLQSLGQEAATIGGLIATAMWMKVVSGPVWGWVADRWGRKLAMVVTSLAAAGVFALFFGREGFWWLLVLTAGYNFFHAAPLSLVEASALEVVNRRGWDYGRMRVWGTLGFVVLSLGMGPGVEWLGVAGVLPVVLILLLINSAIACGVPGIPAHPRPGRVGGHFIRQPGVAWFYLATTLMQLSHSAYYGFFSLHLTNNGYSGTALGVLWALGAVAEVAVMLWGRRLLDRIGIGWALGGSLFIALCRWGLYAVTVNWYLLALGQCLHAFTYGLFHLAAVRRTFDFSTASDHASAQAWYSASSFGLGGGVGLLLSGVLYQEFGSGPLFVVMAGAAGLGMAAVARSSRRLGRG